VVVVSMLALMSAGFALYAVTPAGPTGRPVVALGASLATFGIGASFPMLMDGVISAAPADRAGSSAALAQLANELGIALGLTVLGSLGTVVYRAQLSLPGSTAQQSVIDGLREAGAHHDPALAAAVKGAFTDAFHVAGVVGVLVMGGVLVLAARATRETSEPHVTPAQVPEPVEAAT
jgi:DHA2 family multidrug resistance protein-like MFS transporter